MSDIKAAAATRMFRVKDVDAFLAGLSNVEINAQVVESPDTPNDPRVYLYSDDGGWPDEIFDQTEEVRSELSPTADAAEIAHEGARDFDLVQYVGQHLKEGEVAIFEQVSIMGKDSVQANAEAVNAAGLRQYFDLNDFADAAIGQLGGNPTNRENL